MTQTEGKILLEGCLQKHRAGAEIGDFVHYTVGTRSHASDYQNDEISADIDFSKARSSVTYVVKCFIHLDLYVAWPRSGKNGGWKYIIYKKDLAAMEENVDRTFTTVLTPGNVSAYIFRGEEGIDHFIGEKLLSENLV